MKITLKSPTSTRIKLLQGVGNGPLNYNELLDTSKYFIDFKIPYARLHDTDGPHGGGHYVDIHNVFPNFKADPYDPESYDFFYTDIYIKAIQDTGCETFYRLGETIDHSSHKRYVGPSADYRKWVVICEHIIRHYNEGWAEGFHYGLKYWEIWNEPESPCMWTGTPEQFYELYRVAANHLKQCFGDSIKVGGYSHSGFYALTRENAPAIKHTFVPFMEGFFRYIQDEKTKAPLDFFTWHTYALNAKEVVRHSEIMQEFLDKWGYGDIEHMLTEWNVANFSQEAVRSQAAAAFAAAALCEMQHTTMSAAMYYEANPTRACAGLFERNTVKPCHPLWALKAFSELYKLGYEAELETEGECVSCLAACDAECECGAKNYALLIANESAEAVETSLELGSVMACELSLCDEKHDLTPMLEAQAQAFKFIMPAKSFVLVKMARMR